MDYASLTHLAGAMLRNASRRIFVEGNFISKETSDRGWPLYTDILRIQRPDLNAQCALIREEQVETKENAVSLVIRSSGLPGFFDRQALRWPYYARRPGEGLSSPPSFRDRAHPILPFSWALLKPVYRLFYLIESRGLLFKVLKFKSSAAPAIRY